MKRRAVAGLRVLFSIVFLVLVEKVLRDGLVTIVSVRLLLGRYLQVIDELLSTPLLNKLFLELVQIRRVNLIFFRHEHIKKNLEQERY